MYQLEESKKTRGDYSLEVQKLRTMLIMTGSLTSQTLNVICAAACLILKSKMGK